MANLNYIDHITIYLSYSQLPSLEEDYPAMLEN